VSRRNKKKIRERVSYKWKSANNKEEKIILSELSGYTIKVTIRAAREQAGFHCTLAIHEIKESAPRVIVYGAAE